MVLLRLLPQGAALASGLALQPTAELDWTIMHRGSARGNAPPAGAFRNWTASASALSLCPLAASAAGFDRPAHRWAPAGGPPIVAAYVVHLARLPVWAARARRFRLRARRAGRVH